MTTVTRMKPMPKGKKPASTSETLVSNYEGKLDVRKERAKVTTPLAEQLKDQRLDLPGRQTSPEVAALAGRYLGIPKAERVKWVLAQSPEELSRMLATLSASALGQVNE